MNGHVVGGPAAPRSVVAEHRERAPAQRRGFAVARGEEVRAEPEDRVVPRVRPRLARRGAVARRRRDRAVLAEELAGRDRAVVDDDLFALAEGKGQRRKDNRPSRARGVEGPEGQVEGSPTGVGRSGGSVGRSAPRKEQPIARREFSASSRREPSRPRSRERACTKLRGPRARPDLPPPVPLRCRASRRLRCRRGRTGPRRERRGTSTVTSEL